MFSSTSRRHEWLLFAILATLSLGSTAFAQPQCALPQPFPPCGTNNLTVSKGEAMTLPAGTYGDVRVRNGGTLTLPGGTTSSAASTSPGTRCCSSPPPPSTSSAR